MDAMFLRLTDRGHMPISCRGSAIPAERPSPSSSTRNSLRLSLLWRKDHKRLLSCCYYNICFQYSETV